MGRSKLSRDVPRRQSAVKPDSIQINHDHVDELRQRAMLLEDIRREYLDFANKARRAELLAQHLDESLTAWLARHYPVHPERGEKWHLDFEHLLLRRTDTPNTPDSVPDAPPASDVLA